MNSITPLDQPPLHNAVRNNDVELVKTLIAKGRDIRYIDSRGYTCLHEAVAHPDSKKCLLYILHLAKNIINEKTYEGETPLLVACEHSNLEAAEILLKAGCDPNIPNSEGITPLHYVCAIGNEPIARLLISFGVLLNVQDFNKYTPLHEAITSKSVEICRLLIEAGADVSIKERFGRTPFDLACGQDNLKLVSFLLKHHSNINSRDSCQMTGLMAATQNENYKIVEFLISQGADPNLHDKDLILPIHLAAHSNDSKLLKLLIDRTRTEIVESLCSHECLNDLSRDRYCLRSLPCLALDAHCYENVKLILEAGYSQKVKACPYIARELVLVPSLSLCIKKICDEEMEPKYFDLFMNSNYDFNLLPSSVHALLTPLSAALASGTVRNVSLTVRLLQKLLEAGADVDYQSKCFEVFANYSDLSDCSWVEDKLPDVFKFALACKNISIILLLLKQSCVVEPHHLLNFLCQFQISWTLGTFQFFQPRLYSIDGFCPVVKFLHELSPCFNSKCGFIPSVWRLTSVPSLLSLCRDVIRGQIHNDTENKPSSFFTEIDRLNVPVPLKNYLLYQS